MTIKNKEILMLISDALTYYGTTGTANDELMKKLAESYNTSEGEAKEILENFIVLFTGDYKWNTKHQIMLNEVSTLLQIG